MSYVLEVKDLYKTLGKREIIKGISFSIKEGEIFGFLGPNGAGKTTTIKMLVGLISPNRGSIKVMGNNIQTNKVEALKNVGAVVETPELYTYLTGRQNLQQLARIQKSITEKDIENIVEIVGLKDRIDDKVKKYSLGMKQRLGLAEALIGKPKFIILDEPTNGLDPTGIIEFRNIIKKAAKETKTAVFISSHILSEIQKLCDTVAFINNGEIQSIETINGNYNENTDNTDSNVTEKFEHVVISTKEKENCIKILNSINYIKNVTENENEINIEITEGSVPKLIFNLAKENIPVEEIYKKYLKLEDRYIELVQGGNK
ncbi:ABC transporter ATP-binding protein [Clostridium pasteurianum]|uniref:ABC-type multidrug transport system, ATPase component n=1 Tax=Clostridium pasteurianum BC1 TaxID=86416 RepID=R4JY46_CLOPA|nr:ATP-binding cassette domain-containing protein [Clostridium pasteurianum]AGK95208.1 ABC-type multidrug transport system, ATPase component [Clostridium pasteurianum BC1]